MGRKNAGSSDKDNAKELTVEQAAKAVNRTVIEQDEDGKPQAVKKEVSVEEVLSFKDYVDHIVVVTTDGQKLSSADA